MRPSSFRLLGCLLSLALATLSLAEPARAEPRATPLDAVARFRADTVALGVGYSWGSGHLTFKGRDHNFSIAGLSVVAIGAERVQGVAEVRNLKRLEDFDGIYGLVGASGSFVVLSGATAVLRNAKGVEIWIRGEGQGLSLAVAGGGVRVRLG